MKKIIKKDVSKFFFTKKRYMQHPWINLPFKMTTKSLKALKIEKQIQQKKFFDECMIQIRKKLFIEAFVYFFCIIFFLSFLVVRI